MEDDHSAAGPATAAAGGATIAGEPELEAFSKQPALERRVGEALRGVLAETATTGVVRYSWPLLRPLVEHMMEQVLREYDAEAEVMIGPPLPGLPGAASLAHTIERFRQLLSSFRHAPWTLQRICEILLEPRKQYSHLHKVSLALEKCLLVTSEVPPRTGGVPPPLLSSLGRVNENPPPVYPPTLPGNHHLNLQLPSPPGARHVGGGGSGTSAGGAGHGDGQQAGGDEAGQRTREEDGSSFMGSLMDIRMGGAGEGTAGGAGMSSPPNGRDSGRDGEAERHWPREEPWPQERPGTPPPAHPPLDLPPDRRLLAAAAALAARRQPASPPSSPPPHKVPRLEEAAASPVASPPRLVVVGASPAAASPATAAAAAAAAAGAADGPASGSEAAGPAPMAMDTTDPSCAGALATGNPGEASNVPLPAAVAPDMAAQAGPHEGAPPAPAAASDVPSPSGAATGGASDVTAGEVDASPLVGAGAVPPVGSGDVPPAASDPQPMQLDRA